MESLTHSADAALLHSTVEGVVRASLQIGSWRNADIPSYEDGM